MKILERHKSEVNPFECLLWLYGITTSLCSGRVSELTPFVIVRDNVIGPSARVQ